MGNRMYCKNCGKQLDNKAVACMGCGCDPRKGEKHCPNCGVAVEAAQVVCTKCGGALNAVQQQSPGSDSVAKSKMAYLLLAIFLGEFGVHNFYAIDAAANK